MLLGLLDINSAVRGFPVSWGVQRRRPKWFLSIEKPTLESGTQEDLGGGGDDGVCEASRGLGTAGSSTTLRSGRDDDNSIAVGSGPGPGGSSALPGAASCWPSGRSRAEGG